MEKDGIRAIIEATSCPQVLKVHGVDHLLVPNGEGAFLDRQIPGPEVMPAPMRLSTLKGLAGYLVANRDKLDLETLIVHVSDEATVEVCGPLVGQFNQRIVYARAELETVFGGGFRFGAYLDHETFVVGLQSLFVADEARDAVLRVVSAIKDNLVAVSKDDGVSQTVTTTSGTTLSRRADVPNPVVLRPYRTFREVLQPASPFILRLSKGGSGGLPTIALIEADGGAWKLEAIAAITAAFKGDFEVTAPSLVVVS